MRSLIDIVDLSVEEINGLLETAEDIIKILSASQLANNDGLSFIDWQDWFKDYDHSQPFAIIHFTKFRY